MHEGFLQDIAEHPDDDAPRLVYADWLEENGDPERAEFIRLECRLATMAPGARERAPLEKRRKSLLGKHRKVWVAGIAGLVRRLDFARGFVEEVSVEGQVGGPDRAKVFAEHIDTLFRLAPIRRLRLHKAGDLLVVLASSPHAARLEGLNLRDNVLSARRFEPLARCPSFGRLRVLNLCFNRLGDRGATLLAGAPLFAHLTHLDLSYNGVGPEGLQPLLDSPTWAT